MELNKKLYQISLREDKNKFAIKKTSSSNITIVENLPDSFYEITNEWMDENLIAVIGSNTMTTPIRAFNPILTTNINGSNKLTFQMMYRFYDESENVWRDNPFISLMSNERKIKLKYNDTWYDFIIKRIDESSDKSQATFTCEDQYVNELGKNGFDLTFDIELNNNMGTITELAREVVDETDWEIVGPNETKTLYNGETITSDILLSKNTEILYTYALQNTLRATSLTDGSEVQINAGQVILISSSSYMNQDAQIQFLWVENSLYKVDDKNVVINSDNYIADVPFNYDNTTLYVSGQYRGEIFVTQPVTKWLPEINECADVFTHNGEEYYGVLKTEYLGQAATQELLLNNQNFNGTNYWEPEKVTQIDTPETIEGVERLTPAMKLNFDLDGYVANSGIQVNLGQFSPYGFNPDERLVCMIKTDSSNIRGAALYSLPKTASYPTVQILRTIGEQKYSNEDYVSNITKILDNRAYETLPQQDKDRILELNESRNEYIEAIGFYQQLNDSYVYNGYETLNETRLVSEINKYVASMDKASAMIGRYDAINYYINNAPYMQMILDCVNGKLISELSSDELAEIRNLNSLRNTKIRNNGILKNNLYYLNGYYELTDEILFSELDKFTKGIYKTTAQIGYEDTVDPVQLFFANPDYNSNPGYITFYLRSNSSMSYEEMLDQVWELRLLGAGQVTIKECLLFKEHYDVNGELVIPDMQTAMNQVVQDVYYLFKINKLNDKISGVEQINLDARIEKSQLKERGFEFKINSSPYEKITSITTSKSNRFNIIQSLCETFECWAKFVIDHDDTGHIIHDYSLTNDLEPKTGQLYFQKISSGSSDISFKIIPHSNFYTVSSSAYNKTLNDNGSGYWIKETDNIYVKIDLGYQFSDPNYVYYIYNEETKQYDISSVYDKDSVYYIKISDGTNEYYQRILVSNDYINNTYYIVSNNFRNVYERNFHKYIVFLEYIGNDNYAGFRYGINLNSINRSIDSSNICTRLIVPANNNQYADTGDGFCTIQTSSLNPTGESALYNFQYYLQQNLLNPKDLTRDLYGDITGGLAYLNNLYRWNKEVNPLVLEQSKLLIELAHLVSRKQIYNTLMVEADKQLEEILADIMSAAKIEYVEALERSYEDVLNTDVVKDYIKKRDTIISIKTQYNQTAIEVTNSANIVEQKYNEINRKLNSISDKKKSLNKEFYKKYSRFIQEGTWQSEDYINADRYYLAACDVMATSAFPQISYSINVIDISQVDGYSPYNFKIGDKTYIEDTEFFGWVPETNKPYQEEVIVSEITYSLDDPSQNTIRIQNYKTQFEDLFSRVAAATQSLQYNEGAYGRASNAIKANNTFNGELLKNSLQENSAIISNANAQSVVWGEEGIIITDLVHSNNQVRLVGNGIALTQDGGNTWNTGITANGINANQITTGKLNTQLISIYNDKNPTFTWDQYGLNAYFVDQTGVTNYGRFVRMDKFGLYGVLGGGDSYQPQSITELKQDAYFALTWDGLMIKGTGANGGTAELISDNNGLRLNFQNNSNTINIGLLDSIKPNTSIHEVINANNKFIVYEDGSIKATEGNFDGTIKAENLTINGNQIGMGEFDPKIPIEYLKIDDLEVGKNIKMGSNAVIYWDQINNTPEILDETDVTTITRNTISTSEITAKNLYGGTIYVYGEDKTTVFGEIRTNVNMEGNRAMEIYGNNGMRLLTNKNIYISAGSTAFTLNGDGRITVKCTSFSINTVPILDKLTDLQNQINALK